jgi:hypothetical protein
MPDTLVAGAEASPLAKFSPFRGGELRHSTLGGGLEGGGGRAFPREGDDDVESTQHYLGGGEGGGVNGRRADVREEAGRGVRGGGGGGITLGGGDDVDSACHYPQEPQRGGWSRSLHREHVGLEGHAAALMRNASGVSICTFFSFSEARQLSAVPVKQVH